VREGGGKEEGRRGTEVGHGGKQGHSAHGQHGHGEQGCRYGGISILLVLLLNTAHLEEENKRRHD